MSDDEKSYNILAVLEPRERGPALIAILANSATVASMVLLPVEQRICGFVAFVCLLVVTVLGMLVVRTRTMSQDHDQPQFSLKVMRLNDKLVEDRFLPQLIIAISRSGLAVAGILAKQLGDKKILPVVSLNRSYGPSFGNPSATLVSALRFWRGCGGTNKHLDRR